MDNWDEIKAFYVRIQRDEGLNEQQMLNIIMENEHNLAKRIVTQLILYFLREGKSMTISRQPSSPTRRKITDSPRLVRV